MTENPTRQMLPRWLDRYLWFFEWAMEDEVRGLAAGLPASARVLDAGAGEGRYKRFFSHAAYTGIDLAVGDAQWDYSNLDLLGDLARLPFRDASFDACLNIVTLEHVREPLAVLCELHRVLRSGGRLLLVVPQDWEVHQMPHDYFRYTRFGVRHLMEHAGFTVEHVQAGGGYFRLMGRRMLNGLQFFAWPWKLLAAVFLLPAGFLFPLLDALDQDRNFTLGYICTARK
ncbi:MAG: class I SAM-dependent methyltransferase [Candidatus Solibacter usitatus]|nr:class I SAM-dependent methyltransferase [Candidatus Solibacter usitatus]